MVNSKNKQIKLKRGLINMEKLLEALSKLLPEDQMTGIKEAVEEMLAATKTELEAEYNQNLEEAYAELSEELKESEKVGEEGYREAWEIINDLRNRIDIMRAEYDEALEQGYEEAYQHVLAEKGKNETLESDLYETYEKKYEEAQEYLIDRVHEFLTEKGKEIYENARRDVINDPSMVEHKIVLEKIIENVSDYITEEDRVLATNSKFEAAQKNLKSAEERIRILEAKNIRLSTENNKLTETVKQSAEILSESKKLAVEESRKARVEKAKNVTGRGDVVVKENLVVIGENKVEESKDIDVENDSVLVEGMTGEQLKYMQVLAGVRAND